MIDELLVRREAAALMPTYRRQAVGFVRGRGASLWDAAGRRYVDCMAGISMNNVGHCHPAVVAAIADQAGRLINVSNLYYTEPMVRLAERLGELSGLDRVFFANCGATANEAAIKLARRWGQTMKGEHCYEVISLLDSFHGRSLATLAATGQPAKQATFQPLPTGFGQVAPADLDALEAAIHPSTAGVMLETTQGEGGVVPLPAEYLQGVRRLCDEREVLLIVDDVQAGMGRTGSWFSWQQLGFEPDIATLAKALANGLPIGACLAREDVAKAFQPGDHATTFGGGPVVCAAANAVIDEISESDLLTNCQDRSGQLREGLGALPGVEGMRGRGLLLAAVLDHDRAVAVATAALEHGLIVNAVRPNAVRFAPPLNLASHEAEEAIERFALALGS